MRQRDLLVAFAGLSLGFAAPSFTRAAPRADRGVAVKALADEGGQKETKDKEDVKEPKVDVKDLPVAVVEGVKKAMPDGKITDAEKEKKDDKTVYELDVKVGDTTWEVVVSEDGKILSKEIDKDDEKK